MPLVSGLGLVTNQVCQVGAVVAPGHPYGDNVNDLVLAPEVADALADGNPVVALESTIIAHGLPRPENLKVLYPRLADFFERAFSKPSRGQ